VSPAVPSDPPEASRRWWTLRWEVTAGLIVLVCWIVGVWIRMSSFETTSLDQASIQYHMYAALMARGEPWPAVGPPAAFFIRHGTINPLILTLFQPLCDSLSDSARVAAVLRSLAIPGLYLVCRAAGAPALGIAAAAARAVAPDIVELDRHFGGTYFLDVVLIGSLWAIAAGDRAKTWRLAVTAALLASLPLIHPMGLPAALGLAVGLVLVSRKRPRTERWVIGLAALVPLIPYASVELTNGFGATRSLIGMLTGQFEFDAPGEETVGLLWSLKMLAQNPAPLGLAVPALIAFVASPVAAVVLLVRRQGPVRLWIPAISYCAAAAGLLLFLMAVQSGAGYGYGHHVMSAYVLGIAIAGVGWGWLAQRFPRRLRAEGILAGILALVLLPSLVLDGRQARGIVEQAPTGMSSMGSTAAMADLIGEHRRGPMHLAMVQAPDADPAPPVALSAVVLDMIHDGLPLADLPQYPPEGDVEGWFIMIGAGEGFTPPGTEIPFDDPSPSADQMQVRVWRAERFEDTKAWMEALPEGFEVFGTEEYQDIFEYYFARPKWPGRGGSLPVYDSPYRTADW